MTDPDPAEDLWRWCDLITRPQKRKLVRDGATHAEYVSIPSLWVQLEQALMTGTELMSGHRPPGPKSPADDAIVALRVDIDRTVLEAVRGFDADLRGDLESDFRHVVSLVVTEDDPEVIDWWAQRTKKWVGQAETALGGRDGGPANRELRGFPCPACQSQWVSRHQDGESFRDAAVVAVFSEHEREQWTSDEYGTRLSVVRDRKLRSVICRACGTNWWRGADLDRLAESLLPMQKSA